MKIKGYTFVEMMVVLAIVGILAALVVLSIGYYVKHTQELECRGNIKMLHHAIMEYAVDFNLKPGDSIAVTNMYPRYWKTIDSGTCPAAQQSYGDSFTVGTVPTCPGGVEKHVWDPADDLGL